MRQLYDSPGPFYQLVDITLTNGTTFSLDNSRLWDCGITIEDSVCGSEDKLEVGAAIINKATITINNIDDYFTEYDFNGAQVVPYVGLTLTGSGTVERYQKGVFNVDETSYDGSIITLTCLDRMSLFDTQYSTALSGSTTCTAIVQEIAQRHSITVDSYTWDNGIAVTIPEDVSTITDREMLSYVAQICGVYARMSRTGTLQFGWFNSSFTHQAVTDYDGGFLSNYQTGDTLDGGSFWSGGDTADGGSFSWGTADAHYVTGLWSKDVSVDEVLITGVNVTCEQTAADGTISDVTYSSGTTGYVIGIENNPLVTTANGQVIATYLGGILNGMHYRKASITHLCDPTFEAGDVATFRDGKGYEYNCLVSKTTFRVNSEQQTVSSGESVKRQNATRYSVETKNYTELRNKIVAEVQERASQINDLSTQIANAGGLYYTEETVGGATIHYLHDKPELDESQIVMVLNDIGFSMSDDGGQTWSVSMQVDGTFIANLLSVEGINADWINVGTLNGVAAILESGSISGWTIGDTSIYKDRADPNDPNTIYRTHLQAPLVSNPSGTWFVSSQISHDGGNTFNSGCFFRADGGAWFNYLLNSPEIRGMLQFIANSEYGLDFKKCGVNQINVVLTKCTTSTSKAVRLRDVTNNADVWSYDSVNHYFNVSQVMESEKMIYADIGTNQGNIFFRYPSSEASTKPYNSFVRNDGGYTYLLLTDWDGETWNSYRPISVDNRTGSAIITGTISSSDRRKKHDIAELDERFLDFFDRLTPVGFKWNNGTSGRQHAGFIAQDVKEAMDASGISAMEFAGYVEMEDMDGNSCGLRYDQFIPVLTKKVQEQQRVIDEQQARIDDLEARLKAIEAKLL